MQADIEADQPVTAAFFAVEIGAGLPMELLSKRGGRSGVLAKEVINAALGHSEQCGFGAALDNIPTGDGAGFADAPGDEVSAEGVIRRIKTDLTDGA